MSELHEEIERYVSGEMSDAEQQAFEQKMESDADLAGEVAIYQQTDDLLKGDQLLDFVVMLEEEKQAHLQASSQEAHDEEDTISITPKEKTRFRWYPISAAILLLLVAGIIFWPSTPVDSNTWYAANFEPYPTQSIRNNDDRYPEGVAKALRLYQDEQYREAAALLKPWQTDSIEGTMATFYRTQALMASNQLTEAISLLEQQLAGEPTIYTQSLQWYAALAYLANGETPKALAMTQQIRSTSGHAYNKQAAALINNFED